VEDEDEMAAMVDRCGELKPKDCRASAERFSPERVAAGYEAIYHGVAPQALQPVA
jgi:hypothetical protein